MTKIGGGSLTKAQKLKIKKTGEVHKKREEINQTIKNIGAKTRKKKAERNKVLSKWGKLTQNQRNAIIASKSGKKKTKLKIKPKPKINPLHEFILEVNRQMIKIMEEHDKKKGSEGDLLLYLEAEFNKKQNPIRELITFIKAERKKYSSVLSKQQRSDIKIVLKNLNNIVNPKGGSGQIEPLFNSIMMPSVPKAELPLVFPSVPTTKLVLKKKTGKKLSLKNSK